MAQDPRWLPRARAGTGSKNSGNSDGRWVTSHAPSKRGTTLYTAYNYTDNDRDARVAAGAAGNTQTLWLEQYARWC